MSSIFLSDYHKSFSRELQKKQKTEDKGNLWLKSIMSRDAKGMNSNICVTGEPGIGKSTLSLVTGEDLKPEIFVDHPQEAVERYVTFSGGEFGRAIKESPDGSMIIGDEFGQQMHHRQFMSEPNVALSNVLQGFRFKRYVCFLNLPGLRYLDVDAQGLLTWQAAVKSQGAAEIYLVSHPKFRGDDFHHKVIDSYHFRKPRSELWKVYVEKKVANQERVFDRAIRTMDSAEGVKEKTDSEMAQIVVAQQDRFKTEGKFDVTKIEDEFHIGFQRANGVMKRAKRGASGQ